MRLRLALITGFGLLALFACLYTYRAEGTDTFFRSAGSFGTVNITTRNGAVTVTPSAETVAQVQITRYAYGRDRDDARQRLGQITAQESVASGAWRLWVSFPTGSVPMGAEVTARLPGSAGLNITTSNGRVSIAGITGGVTVNTSNGGVEFTGTGGDGFITTSNADVAVRVHSGGMTVNNTNGGIECDLSHLPAIKGVSLQTTSGSVVLSLPPDVSCLITASTGSGTVVITGFQAVYEEQSQTRVRARIGSGASRVTISTLRGDVVIRNRINYLLGQNN